jgi:hypothetical protein
MRAGSSQRATEGNGETGRGEVTPRVATGDRVADELIDVTIQSPAQTRSGSPGHRRETAQFTNPQRSARATARAEPPAEAAALELRPGSATERKRRLLVPRCEVNYQARTRAGTIRIADENMEMNPSGVLHGPCRIRLSYLST